uniref:Secreted protein n=1 Tax=Plectus sambesii TaxID=2011161 RepID=A0A914VPK6_9BILA
MRRPVVVVRRSLCSVLGALRRKVCSASALSPGSALSSTSSPPLSNGQRDRARVRQGRRLRRKRDGRLGQFGRSRSAPIRRNDDGGGGSVGPSDGRCEEHAS